MSTPNTLKAHHVAFGALAFHVARSCARLTP